MLPSPDAKSQPLKRPQSPDADGKLVPFSFSPLQRLFLFVAVLSLQLTLLLLSASSSTSSAFFRRSPPPPPPPASCPYGHLFVYDLPSTFNIALVSNCSALNPWNSRCPALTNNGFGMSSAADLAGVIPSPLLSSWFATDQFAAELIFHHRILSHPCRTLNSSVASAFYIPFYAGLAVGKHLWLSSPSSAAQRDRDCNLLLNWIRTQPPWLRSNGGHDHFIMLGRITWDFRRSHDADWGSSFLYMPQMQNVTRLLIERNPWDPNDIAVPYPTSFHPKSLTELQTWQHFVLKLDRNHLFSFAGARRDSFKNDFRGLLLDECARANGTCRSLDCGGGKCGGNSSRGTVELFLGSRFCLQPRGDSFTRRSMFDCMLAGAIPVLFWRRSAYLQYEWFLEGRGEEWSVFVDRVAVREGRVSLRKVLEGIGEVRERRMREKVVEMLPRLVYGGGERGIGDGVRDAFDVAVDGVFRMFTEKKGRL